MTALFLKSFPSPSKELPFMMKQYRTSLFSVTRISSVPPAISSRPLMVFVASALSAFLVPTSRKGIPILNKSFLTAVTSLVLPLRSTPSHLLPSLLSTSRILGARSCMAQPWARHIASLSTNMFRSCVLRPLRKFCCFFARTSFLFSFYNDANCYIFFHISIASAVL